MEGNDANPGLNRRALSELFRVLEERKIDWSFEIEVRVRARVRVCVHFCLV
jgi:hypothetical protein